MGDEFDDTSLDAMDIAPVEDTMLDTSGGESFDIPESFDEDMVDDVSYDSNDGLVGEDTVEVPLEFSEDVDDLNDVTDPDPYDIPESFVEDTEEITADDQNDVTDDTSEIFSEDTAEVPTEFDEDFDDLNEINDPDPYDIPESFEEDTEADVQDIQADIPDGTMNDFPEDTNAADYVANSLSSDVPESFIEDTEEMPTNIQDALNEEIPSDMLSIGETDSLAEDSSLSEGDSEAANTFAPDTPNDTIPTDFSCNPDALDDAAFAGDTTPTTIEDLWKKVDEISNSGLSNEHKLELLHDIQNDLSQGLFSDDGDTSEEGPVKVLKRDELDLLSSGSKNIDDTLSVKEDDYRDKGYTDEEISTMLANDKIQLQEEFLRDAFPGQEVSPHVFDYFGDAANTQVPDHSPDLSASNLVDGFESGDQYFDISSEGRSIPVATDLNKLTDISNWLGDINPNFDEFDIDSPYCNNCGSCAYAVYQRLEGSNDACASADNIPYNSDMTALTGMEQVSMSPEEIKNRLLAEGDGAHAIIGIDRAEGCGHWFNAACIDGKVVAIDGQTGEVTDWPPDYGDVVNWEMSIKPGMEKEYTYGHKTR